MNEKLRITQWAEEDRPREKMMLHGPAALSNAELLAILIGSGNAEDTAVGLMRKVLEDCHNRLSELGKYTVDDLCRYKGIGPAKAVWQPQSWESGDGKRNLPSVSGLPVRRTCIPFFIHCCATCP